MRYTLASPVRHHTVPDTEAFDAVMARMLSISGCGSRRQLAAFLGTHPGAISRARRQLRIPVGWLRTLFMRTYASPLWILAGDGQKTL